MSCLFCKIINREIPSEIVFEDENIIAFKDISPVAPVHILVIPKNHVESAYKITKKTSLLVSNVFEKIPEIAKKLGITEFRIINNCGPMAGQSVFHLHFHLIGGKKLGWTPA